MELTRNYELYVDGNLAIRTMTYARALQVARGFDKSNWKIIKHGHIVSYHQPGKGA